MKMTWKRTAVVQLQEVFRFYVPKNAWKPITTADMRLENWA